MAETIGSLADKISIIQLKIFHMREQLERADATQEHKAACAGKLEVMGVQVRDLEDELTQLVSDVASGKVKLKIYRQFKMYNDPRYRAAAAK
ncbi:MAG: hypothetical protein A2X29_03310 [Elusimicrobia bacterium GWA2_64_40]|nr:MAG: hypothetical protein A2X29_03310 [Elusimicrobia bacterium GWA2_64_40]OGR67412.1 MAG: hypothetical protein A2X30_05645 [Elusimicrobia bacterium GWB2_63_16]HAN05314.1 hypothetical protein [Elusimicrobiota bacterium]